MEISNELIDKLSTLAKLRFEDEEKEAIKQDLSKMLAFINKVQEVDTVGIEPLIYMNTEVNRWREDEPQTPLSHQEILSNAPKKDSDYIRVPKVIE